MLMPRTGFFQDNEWGFSHFTVHDLYTFVYVLLEPKVRDRDWSIFREGFDVDDAQAQSMDWRSDAEVSEGNYWILNGHGKSTPSPDFAVSRNPLEATADSLSGSGQPTEVVLDSNCCFPLREGNNRHVIFESAFTTSEIKTETGSTWTHKHLSARVRPSTPCQV